MYCRYTLFKGCSEEQLHEAIELRLRHFRASAKWNSDDDSNGLFLGIISKNDVHTVRFSYGGGVYGFFHGIGAHLNCPWMEARIQDGSHWDFSLMKGGVSLDPFSTFPQYYDRSRESRRKFQGNPKQLAETWGVPLKRIERYMVNWGDAGLRITKAPFPFLKTLVVDSMSGAVNILSGRFEQQFRRKGKAYTTDKSEYGDCYQLDDFIRALGGDVPNSVGVDKEIGEKQHRLFFPDHFQIYEGVTVDWC